MTKSCVTLALLLSINGAVAHSASMLPSQSPAVQAKLTQASLTDLVNLALQNDANWQSTQFTAKAQQENYTQARSQLLPQLQYSAQTSYNNDSGTNFNPGKYNSNSQSLRLSQPLFRLDSWFAAKKAKAEYDQANAELEAEAHNLTIKVATAYFDWLKAQAQLNFANAEIQAYQKQQEQAQLNFKAGLAAITDSYEAQAESDLAYARQIAARNQLALAKKNIQSMTLIPVESVLTTTLASAQKIPEKTFVDWVEFAKLHSPDYHAAILAAEAAKQGRRAQASNFGPQLDLVGSYTDSNNAAFSNQLVERKSSQIALQVNWPLWTSGNNISRYRQANYQTQAADMHAIAVEREAAVKITQLLDQLKADSDLLEAQQQAKKSSETALKATQAGYRAGTRTVVEVLQSESKYLSSIKDYQTALYDYLLHQLQFEQVVGSLSAEKIAALSEKN